MRQRLRQLRLERGISQTFLAKKLGYSHASGYGNIESGRNNLSFEKALVIADIFGVDVSELEEKETPFFNEKLHKKCKSQIPA